MTPLVTNQLLSNSYKRCIKNDYEREYFWFVTFSVTFTTRRLISQTYYSPKQQELYELILGLKNQGLGYRRIANYLNEHKIKTKNKKKFSNGSVQFILLRYKQRQERMNQIANEEITDIWSKMKMIFSK